MEPHALAYITSRPRRHASPISFDDTFDKLAERLASLARETAMRSMPALITRRGAEQFQIREWGT